MTKRIDLTGQRFGRLVVLKYIGSHDKKRFWKCQCDCGNTTNVATPNLTRGTTRSCGCLAKESATSSIEKNSTVKRFGADSKEFIESKIKATKVYKERYVKDGVNIKNLDAKIGRNNTSGVKGVAWDKSREKWLAYIQLAGKRKTLGRFIDKEEAIRVRKEAEETYYKPMLENYRNEEKP